MTKCGEKIKGIKSFDKENIKKKAEKKNTHELQKNIMTRTIVGNKVSRKTMKQYF